MFALGWGVGTDWVGVWCGVGRGGDDCQRCRVGCWGKSRGSSPHLTFPLLPPPHHMTYHLFWPFCCCLHLVTWPTTSSDLSAAASTSSHDLLPLLTFLLLPSPGHMTYHIFWPLCCCLHLITWPTTSPDLCVAAWTPSHRNKRCTSWVSSCHLRTSASVLSLATWRCWSGSLSVCLSIHFCHCSLFIITPPPPHPPHPTPSTHTHSPWWSYVIYMPVDKFVYAM